MLRHLRPKIKIAKTTTWQHHRSGWSDCMKALMPLHTDQGVLLVDYVEEPIKMGNCIAEPWIGFVHNCIKNPVEIAKRYGMQHAIDLTSMIEKNAWIKSYDFCRGIFCMSSHSVDFISKRCPSLPVSYVKHPTHMPEIKFSLENYESQDSKKILMIGHWMRNFSSFVSLKCENFKKLLLCVPSACRYEDLEGKVEMAPRLPNREYDDILSRSVVFLNLYDVAACNTILECIVRNTPVFINRLPGAVEYLGENYPLFYEDLGHAEYLLQKKHLIEEAHSYLRELSSAVDFSIDNFLCSVYRSKVYENL